MRDPELLDQVPRGRDHASCRLGAAAQRFEDRLAAQGDRLDRRRTLSDAQHAHDVETTTAGTRDGTRSPERGERRPGQDSVGAPAIVSAPRGGKRSIERRLARADRTQARERERMHRVGLRLTRSIGRRGQCLRRGRDRVGRSA